MPKTMDEYIKEFQERKPQWNDKARMAGIKVKNKVIELVQWIKENPAEAAIVTTITTAAAGGLKRIARSIDRNVTVSRERYNKERYTYDHSTNTYVKHRKLRNDDIRRINELRRKNPGMKMTEAMERLNLLD